MPPCHCSRAERLKSGFITNPERAQPASKERWYTTVAVFCSWMAYLSMGNRRAIRSIKGQSGQSGGQLGRSERQRGNLGAIRDNHSGTNRGIVQPARPRPLGRKYPRQLDGVPAWRAINGHHGRLRAVSGPSRRLRASSGRRTRACRRATWLGTCGARAEAARGSAVGRGDGRRRGEAARRFASHLRLTSTRRRSTSICSPSYAKSQFWRRERRSSESKATSRASRPTYE